MSSPPLEPISNPPEHEALVDEVSRLASDPEHHFFSRGPFVLLFFRKEHAPNLFYELCRQREITFRLAGQGTGAPYDETPEDAYYDQLILWDTAAQKLAGAYRVGRSGRKPGPREGDDLYLTHMFEFEQEFFTRDNVSMELTRSFVVPEYQVDRSALLLLWQGVGATVRRLEATRLFGSVTLSADFHDDAQKAMVSWLATHRIHQPHRLATALNPFPDQSKRGWNEASNIDDLKSEICGTDGRPKAIPPLLRHYLKLGASFHAFHIEASFNNAIYCLLEVDIAKMPPSHYDKFIAGE